MQLLPVKTTLAIATFFAIAALPDYVPALQPYKLFEWRNLLAVAEFRQKTKTSAADPIVEEEQHIKPTTAPQKAAIYPLEESEDALDHFYAALYRTEQGEPGAVTQILHYGDSPTTADLITSDVRSMLQKRFGDAGHGFFLVAKPWAWYGHQGVEISGSGWRIEPATQGSHDGLFGLGGVSFSAGSNASSRITVKDPHHNAIEIDYLQQPGGGSLEVLADGQMVGEVQTAGEEYAPGYNRVSLPSGAHQITLRSTNGPVRLFGASLEKDQPGIRYHSLGLNGAYVSVLAKFFKEGHWARELQHYHPDLVVVNYGTNESMYANFVDYAYAKEMKEVVRRLRVALPDTSILIMSPMDRGQRDRDGEIGTVPTLPRLVSIQQKLAADTHCAFFNTYEAMGGAGTMGRWYEAEPRLVGADFIHPMPAGARMVGNLLYRGLMDGYNRYKLRRMNRRFTLVSVKK